MGVDCLKCVNSACCSLTIYISRKEFHELHESVKPHFVTHTDKFIEKHPDFSARRGQIDAMYEENYAEMNKSEDGYCPLLDRKTMLCSVHENKPDICKRYTTDRCEKIRLLK